MIRDEANTCNKTHNFVNYITIKNYLSKASLYMNINRENLNMY